MLRQRYRYVRLAAVLGTLGAAACAGGPTAPTEPLRFTVVEPGAVPVPPTGPSVRIEGEWRGTTDTGLSVSITISPARRVTRLSVEYRTATCSGVTTHTDLDLPTLGSYTGDTAYLDFDSGVSGASPRTTVFGMFQTANLAKGNVSVSGYPGCGNEQITGAWTATRP